MQLSSLDPDKFMATYRLHGRYGTQPMVALGRGCPTLGGTPVDISSHWFDPARSGTGYSVQTWADYEFFAAFMYDEGGEPMFFAAESPTFAGLEADLPLEALGGSCPTCNYRPPLRIPAGFLHRRLAGGTLSEITLDVDYPEDFPYSGQRTWTVTDRVQTLGGPGTTQGCAP